MKFTLFSICSWFIMASLVTADVHMPSIFSDNMVLQRNSTVKLWGFAKAGEPVNVTIHRCI